MKKRTIFKLLRNLLFFVVLVLLTFWLLFKNQDLGEIVTIAKSADIIFIILGILVMLLYYLMEAYNIRCILKTLDEKISILSALKFTLIGFFFSAITPAATGGQPIELYYMTKEKISGAKATMALLLQLCGFQISTISLGIICAILNPSILQNGLIWLFLLGLLINGFALTLMLICIFSQALTRKLVNILINILKFFRFKNIEKTKENLEKELVKYNESSIFVKSHKLEFIKAILRVFIQICLYHSITYFVYKAFGLTSLNILQIFSMQAVLYTTVSGIPLPGAVGISENVFLGIFGVAFGKELLSSAMLLSRGITFYLYVIVSVIVVIINALKMKNVKGELDEQET